MMAPPTAAAIGKLNTVLLRTASRGLGLCFFSSHLPPACRF
jgi:hypothetical protein